LHCGGLLIHYLTAKLNLWEPQLIRGAIRIFDILWFMLNCCHQDTQSLCHFYHKCKYHEQMLWMVLGCHLLDVIL
jgi:hypothetical protein